MEDLRLPELGENIEVVEVSAVLVAVGDTVRRDQPVIEVETEKASLEVPSAVDGQVVELLVEAGDQVSVGQVVARIDAAGAGERSASRPAETPAPSVERSVAVAAAAAGCCCWSCASEAQATAPPEAFKKPRRVGSVMMHFLLVGHCFTLPQREGRWLRALLHPPSGSVGGFEDYFTLPLGGSAAKRPVRAHCSRICDPNGRIENPS